MRIVLITSTGIRHAYLAQKIASQHDLVFVVREEKALEKSYVANADQEHILEHFAHFDRTEREFFGASAVWDSVACRVHSTTRGFLNTSHVADEVSAMRPDVVVVFGCGIIKPPLLDVLPKGHTWNLHQGLSPYYRGSGTNFWPFVEGRFEYIGATLHLLDAGVDSGGIIAHVRPSIQRNDTLHVLGCKTVAETADLLLTALSLMQSGVVLEPIAQWGNERVYRRADLTGAAIERVREREMRGEVAEFVQRRASGLVAPVRLITLSV